jgi:ribonuclease HII
MPVKMPRLLRHDFRAIEGVEFLVGVDEAGRGALFGPVHAAAVIVTPAFLQGDWCRRRAKLVRDSKQMEPDLRAEVFEEIRGQQEAGNVFAAVASGSVQEIDLHNILGATQLAMARAIREVLAAARIAQEPSYGLFSTQIEIGTKPLENCRILIDGRPLKKVGFPHQGLVKGDDTSLAIAMASVLAKVSRDREIERMDAEYAGYGLASNKGYGTPEHLRAIRRLGATPMHREKFLRKLLEQKVENPGQGWFELEEEPPCCEQI